ncbi:MAG TPA: TIM barrel protein, partial [Candidatus Paceibacterota bacterium]|nr:TIM barrel protein [Candidatus Paceibacterota bacterium]
MFNPISHHHVPGSRRHFLRRAGVLAAGGALAPSLLANAMSTSPIGNSPASRSKPSGAKEAAFLQIGILLGTFVRPTLRERLDTAKSRGLECVQVSMDCAGLSEMPDQISSDLVDRIRSDAASSGITIAAVQGTFNMAHPDADHRQTGLRRLRVIAEACPRMGASMIHICSGTRSRESMWRRHPDNNSPAAWLDMAACMREAAEIARQSGTLLAFEPEVNNVVDSAQKAR